MKHIKRNALTLLFALTVMTTTLAQSQPFIVSYWANAKNDTVGTVRMADYDASLLKLIWRQPMNGAVTVSGQHIDDTRPNGTSPYHVFNNIPKTFSWNYDAQVDYTAPDGTQHTEMIHPKASAQVSIKAGKVYWGGTADGITAVSALQPLITVTGMSPQTVCVRQPVIIGPQTVVFEWSYDDYGLVKTSTGLAPLPYLQPDMPELLSVEIQETAASQQASQRLAPINMETSTGRVPASAHITSLKGQSKEYEVKARFRQQIVKANAPDQTPITHEFDVSYLVVLVNELVDVAYEKDFKWIEAHDNLDPTTYYIVRRIRTYSSGEKLTDTFTCPHGWGVERNISANVNGYGNWKAEHEYQHNDSVRFVYHKYSDEKNNDYIKILYLKTGVPDLSLLSWEIGEDFDGWNIRNEHLNEYGDAATYSFKYNLDAPVEDWYVAGILRKMEIWLYYNFNQLRYHGFVREYSLSFQWYDRFLYIDGQLFDFSDYRMTCDFDFREETTTLSDGTPAKVFTHDCTGHYLGRDFYIATVDTLYQLPK